jgi:hypothetical protein
MNRERKFRELDQYTLEVKEYKTRCYCKVCLELFPKMFMVQDKLWLKHFKATDIVCLKCFIEKIERPLKLKDFKSVPLNANYIMLLSKYDGRDR